MGMRKGGERAGGTRAAGSGADVGTRDYISVHNVEGLTAKCSIARSRGLCLALRLCHSVSSVSSVPRSLAAPSESLDLGIT